MSAASGVVVSVTGAIVPAAVAVASAAMVAVAVTIAKAIAAAAGGSSIVVGTAVAAVAKVSVSAAVVGTTVAAVAEASVSAAIVGTIVSVAETSATIIAGTAVSCVSVHALRSRRRRTSGDRAGTRGCRAAGAWTSTYGTVARLAAPTLHRRARCHS